MFERELAATAAAMVAPGKGILAIDESSGTIKKRFDSIGIESNVENRRAYRDLLIMADGLNEYISGMILYDETIKQSALNGTPFPAAMKKAGILAGINIGKDIPSQYCIDANTHALARYAALCQEAGIVPIVEPEVIMDGAHTLERCFDVTENTLATLFNTLHRQRVRAEHLVLKASMVISGKQCPQQASVQQVADATVQCLKRTVPSAVPGIVFLSGGQSDELATAHLNAMNAGGAKLPWPLSFSDGRALQAPALKAWKGQPGNVAAAQKALMHRSKLNSAAATGRYKAEMEKQAA